VDGSPPPERHLLRRAARASDYLLYGYLQQGRDDLAEEELRRMAAVKEVYPPKEQAAAVARALSPVRGALERERWEAAATLEVPPILAFEAYPFVRGFAEYSPQAREAAAALETLSKSLPPGPLGYFGKLLDSYRLATLAWIAHAEKKDEEAVRLLTTSADLEDGIGPHPVMPGPLLPAREQLADLLLELGRPEQALAAYQRTLVLYPGRLRSTTGAMRAASAAGRSSDTKTHAREVASLLSASRRPLLEEARALSK
jgi:tetratricopeptide (TPR) repeat protein